MYKKVCKVIIIKYIIEKIKIEVKIVNKVTK